MSGAPRIRLLERTVKLVDVDKIQARVGRLAHEKPQIYHREHDVTNIRRSPNSPVLQYHSSHHSESLERKIAYRADELSPVNVAPFG